MDRAGRRLLLRDRPALRYDLVSINIGSTPQVGAVPGAAAHAVAVKPIHRFNQRWLALLERMQHHAGPATVAVVGGGAGGVELLLAMQYRLRAALRERGRDPDALVFHLFTADATVLSTHSPAVQRRFTRVLCERGVQLHTGAAVHEVQRGRLRTQGGLWFDADEIVWVTQAGGAPWLRETGLALDERGFIRVNDALQSVADPLVFAAGDVASMDTRALEKAGVFAVRMAKPLARNLRLALAHRGLKPYRPQRRWLALISTGDRVAVASRGALSFAGAWVWRWKDWIDRRFMRRFSEFPALDMAQAPAAVGALALTAEEASQALSAVAMRCGGCGAKVGASVLSRALADLVPRPNDAVLIGLHAGDDAAVVRVPPGMAMVHTVDFFRAFIDDPYVFGQIAANHALGDIFAMGAEPQSATAIATLPPGLEDKIEEQLRQMMSGAVQVLDAAGCALVGGHTGEGSELALGFAVNGLVDASLRGVLCKGGMRAGDVLVLTKPIGTGTLMAAHARLVARGRWVQGALDMMRQSSQDGAGVLRAHGATACTDVTGFGLLGHLLELARASGVDARLSLSALPLLEGAQACAQQGIVSSLQAANQRLRDALRNQQACADHPRYPLLFDPQTAGGLLASVPADQAPACIDALRAAGYAQAAVIGQALARRDARASITLVD